MLRTLIPFYTCLPKKEQGQARTHQGPTRANQVGIEQGQNQENRTGTKQGQ